MIMCIGVQKECYGQNEIARFDSLNLFILLILN